MILCCDLLFFGVGSRVGGTGGEETSAEGLAAGEAENTSGETRCHTEATDIFTATGIEGENLLSGDKQLTDGGIQMDTDPHNGGVEQSRLESGGSSRSPVNDLTASLVKEGDEGDIPGIEEQGGTGGSQQPGPVTGDSERSLAISEAETGVSLHCRQADGINQNPRSKNHPEQSRKEESEIPSDTNAEAEGKVPEMDEKSNGDSLKDKLQTEVCGVSDIDREDLNSEERVGMEMVEEGEPKVSEESKMEAVDEGEGKEKKDGAGLMEYCELVPVGEDVDMKKCRSNQETGGTRECCHQQDADADGGAMKGSGQERNGLEEGAVMEGCGQVLTPEVEAKEEVEGVDGVVRSGDSRESSVDSEHRVEVSTCM